MYPITCLICLPTPGIVMLRKGNYETKYHCRCKLGEPHRYEGSECSKYTTHYYCASVDTLPAGTIEALISDNEKRYGIRKVGDRWMKPDGVNLSPEQVNEMKQMAWAMMKVNI